jgi:arginase
MEKSILELLSNGPSEVGYRHLKSKKVTIVGVAEKGGQEHDGPDQAPMALRDGGLHYVAKKMGWDVEDLMDISDETIGKFEKELSSIETFGGIEDAATASEEESKKAKETSKPIVVKQGDSLGRVCKVLHKVAKKAAQEGNFFLNLGGDHGIATGSISGMLAAHPDLRVIWVDAHGDINTPESSPSGNYHGMPVAHLTGIFSNVQGFEWMTKFLPKDRIVFIGLRDIDDAEKQIIRNNKIKYFSMTEIDRYGIGAVMEATLKYLDPESKNHPIHISWDVDGVDPIEIPQTGTMARGGLTYREAHYVIRRTVESRNLVSLDLVEINPAMDPKSERKILHGDDPKITGTESVCQAIELIRSALGHTLV